MPEAIPQFESFGKSIITSETNLNFFSLESMGSQPTTNEVPHQDKLSQSRSIHNRIHDIGVHSESDAIDAPLDLIEDLLVPQI
jgi:hypothetical protein